MHTATSLASRLAAGRRIGSLSRNVLSAIVFHSSQLKKSPSQRIGLSHHFCTKQCPRTWLVPHRLSSHLGEVYTNRTRTCLQSKIWQRCFSQNRACLFEKSCPMADSVDQELSTKLRSELDHESEVTNLESLEKNVERFLKNSSFTLEDKPGAEKVTLTREYENEIIKVVFSIDDINQQGGVSSDFEEEGDELDNSTSSKTNEESSDPESTPDEDENPSFPCRLKISIQKADKKGHLQFEAIVEDAEIMIESVQYLSDKSKQSEKSYTGPPFSNLDEEVQLLFERFLEERGIGTELALFVPEYIDLKEQREYVHWLKSVEDFVN